MNLKAESQKSSLNSREKKTFFIKKKRALGTDKMRKDLTLMSSLFQEKRMSIVI